MILLHEHLVQQDGGHMYLTTGTLFRTLSQLDSLSEGMWGHTIPFLYFLTSDFNLGFQVYETQLPFHLQPTARPSWAVDLGCLVFTELLFSYTVHTFVDFVNVCFTEIFKLISTNVTQTYLFWVVPSQTKTAELSNLRFSAELNRLMRFSAAAVATEGKKTGEKQHIACDVVLCVGSPMI